MENVPELSIKEAIPFFLANVNLQIEGHDMAVPYIVGDPGIGKTRFIEQECEKLGYGFIPFHFSLIPIEEIGGLPVFKKILMSMLNSFAKIKKKFFIKDEESGELAITGTEWTLPDIMTKIYEMAATHPKVVVLLDDFHMCSPAHLSLGYEMFTERKLRDFKLPDNVGFLLAGNHSAKSGAKQMFGAIINRLAVYKVVPDFSQWMSEYAIPNGINQKVVSFLKNQINRPYFIGEESTNEPWPSPRSWSRFSALLNPMEEHYKNMNISLIMYHANAHVGPKAASEFSAYYDIYSKTEMDQIFNKKKEIIIPSNNTDCYIYGMSASNEYVNRIIEAKADSVKNNTKFNKNNKAITDTVDIISNIIVKIGKGSIDISVALLKNISDYENALGNNNKREALYIEDIIEKIHTIDPVIDSKITKSITEILGATT
jgi:hypothetical protein